jgi:ParB-like chromosome segregation protein Spo0J
VTDPHIAESLVPLAVPVDSLVPYDRNPRRGDVDAIAESLTANGQYRPIVVRTGSNEVLAGNHLLLAAKRLGWPAVAATFVNVTDDEAARIVLVDNRAADRGTYDDRELLDLLRELEVSEAALVGTGYGTDDLDDLAALVSEAEQAAVAEKATEDGAKGNAWESTDLKEYADRYEEQGRRLVVLDYDRADYTRVTAALDLLRAELSVESNSEAVAVHLRQRFPDVTAEVDADLGAVGA